MKNGMRMSLFVVAGLACSITASAMAQNTTPSTHPSKTPAATKGTKEHQPKANFKAPPTEAGKMWEEMSKPSAECVELVKHFAGNWDTKSTYFAAPNAEPVVSTGHAKFWPAVGGRFVECEHNGTIMGMPFNGQGWYTFNKVTSKYENAWIDNGAPGIMVSYGTKTSDNTIEWTGTYNDPTSGAQKTARSTTTWQGDTFTFSMYSTSSDGREFKSLEVVYTRNNADVTDKHQIKSTPATPHHDPTDKPGKTVQPNDPNKAATPKAPSTPANPK